MNLPRPVCYSPRPMFFTETCVISTVTCSYTSRKYKTSLDFDYLNQIQDFFILTLFFKMGPILSYLLCAWNMKHVDYLPRPVFLCPRLMFLLSENFVIISETCAMILSYWLCAWNTKHVDYWDYYMFLYINNLT